MAIRQRKQRRPLHPMEIAGAEKFNLRTATRYTKSGVTEGLNPEELGFVQASQDVRALLPSQFQTIKKIQSRDGRICDKCGYKHGKEVIDNVCLDTEECEWRQANWLSTAAMKRDTHKYFELWHTPTGIMLFVVGSKSRAERILEQFVEHDIPREELLIIDKRKQSHAD